MARDERGAALVEFALLLPLTALNAPALLFQTAMRFELGALSQIVLRVSGLVLMACMAYAGLGVTAMLGALLAAEVLGLVAVWTMASTLTIDSLAVGMRVLNVAFEPDGQGDTILRFYDYNHFRDLVRIAKLPLARSAEDVIAFVARCLAGNREPGIDEQAFEEFYVPAFSAQYPSILRETAEEILASS